MRITEINSRNEWEKAVSQSEMIEFLQSWNWGEFQKTAGNRPIRLSFVDQQKQIRCLQCFEHRIGSNFKYLYLPRIVANAEIIESLKSWAAEKNFVFLRVEPAREFSIDKFNLKNVIIKNRQPRHTSILNLEKTEDDLLSAMHSKTRYNIRLSGRKGVDIKDRKDLGIFWRLNQQTTQRDKFRSHQKSYYEKMLASDMCYQLTAWYDHLPIASNLYLSHDRRTTYLHGTSSNQHRSVMAPYLLQWQAIKKAKQDGHREYDFWGVAEPAERIEHPDLESFHKNTWKKSDPWSGVTRFKAGFDGQVAAYPDAFDVPVKSSFYKMYRFLRKVLRKGE